jgi:hypothetical protein
MADIVLSRLKTRIERIDKTEAKELFKIVFKNKIKYTRNKNGIFLNLLACDDQCINEFRCFLDFIDANKKHIIQIENKIQENKLNLEFKSSFNNYAEKFDYVINISNDYSPFVTTDNEIVSCDLLDEIKTECELETNQEQEIETEFDQEIDPDINEDIEGENDETAASVQTQRKKKTIGFKARLLKRCKNIATGQCDEDERDYIEESVQTELTFDIECI